MSLVETIAAIATAPGAAGLAVVRLSGPAALRVADRIFRGASPLAVAKSHTVHHGWVVESDEDPAATPERRIDEVLATIFRAPRSYTREDVVEFSCHGGALSSQRLLAAALVAGARMARPGEFTLRAFLNGRIDLAQAEAVADLIRAETASAYELALSQLAGELSRAVSATADRIADALAEVEARVDFAEDVGGVEVPPHVVATLGAVERDLAGWLAGGAFARAVREGVRVPLVGRPNVGKSSLFNALLGEARAIVTEVPGTTRDRVSEAIDLAGIRVTLSDTAGLGVPGDPVEAIGIERARETLEGSAVALWVVDAADRLADEDGWIARRLADKRVLVALNKSDRPPVTRAADVEALLDGAPRRLVAVSAVRGDGLDALRGALAELLGAEAGVSAAAAPRAGGLAGAAGNPRHAEALERSRAALVRASAAAAAGLPGEIVALELRESLAALGEVTGRTIGEDLLDRIFSRFCVGK